MSRIDYETDITKHFVRTDGCLDAFRYRNRKIKSAIRGKRRHVPISYFTFCAASAIDVFMLEQNGLIARERRSGRLEHVYFCECDEVEFSKISNLIGSADAGFMEKFEDFVLFEDNDTTKGKDGFDDREKVSSDPSIRRKFSCKALQRRFIELFPFDVLNLDFYGNLFPPRAHVYSPLLQSIKRIFEWQTRRSSLDDHKCEGFTVFLTAYVNRADLNVQAVENLALTVRSNLQRFPELAQAFESRFLHRDPELLIEQDFPVFFSIILPKIVANIAIEHGWIGRHRKIYIYSRPEFGTYYMMTSIVCYEKIDFRGCLPGPPRDRKFERYYVPEMTSVFSHKPLNVNDAIVRGGDNLRLQLSADLTGIVAFRDNLIASLGE